MLRQICKPLLQGVRSYPRAVSLHCSSIRSCSTRKDDTASFDAQLEQLSTPEFNEPKWAWDEEEAKQVYRNKETEQFSFDPEKGILQEPEDERLDFEKYLSKFGEARYVTVTVSFN